MLENALPRRSKRRRPIHLRAIGERVSLTVLRGIPSFQRFETDLRRVLLDAGLRLGEACALKWGDFVLAEDPKDTTRVIHVRRALSRGKHLGPPKSGRSRDVQMSRRLWAMLRRRYERAGRPGPDAWVFTSRRDLPGVDPDNYRSRHFARV